MKDRKLGSFNIRDMRESSRKSKEEPNKTKTSLLSEKDSKRRTQPKLDGNFQLQKEFVKAENLTEEEQKRIKKEAERTVGKKARTTEVKIENQMIGMLEVECSRLGRDLEEERMQSQKLRTEVGELRKKVEFLGSKLENVHREHDNLARNNDYGKMEKDQLKQELQRMRSSYEGVLQDLEGSRRQFQNMSSAMKMENQELKAKVSAFDQSIREIREEKEEIEEEYQEKCRQYEYLREKFQERKRQWDQMRQEMENHTRDHLDRKGQKITKFQVQLQNANDKLREEEGLRKKLIEKNKELEKEITKRGDVVRDMEDQINNLKKRINDLSILKSSNNAIMNQKLSQLSEENAKLRKNLEGLEGGKGRGVEEESKPYLFGPQDDD